MTKAITAKFGGTSLASAVVIKKVAAIIRSNPNRRYIVVSAPGRRIPKDPKITDLLLACATYAHEGRPFEKKFELIKSRFDEIADNLACPIPLQEFEEVRTGIRTHRSLDWVASRGEWIMARLLARYLDADFVDATELIRVDAEGVCHRPTQKMITQKLSDKKLVIIPGFYAADKAQHIRLFPRGGSDITGALVAKYTGSYIYENWTDVDGVYTTPPRFAPSAKPLKYITFREMRELGYRGAEVLQRDALLPLIKIGVPIQVKNTFNPRSSGTMIVPDREVSKNELIAGISGSSGFVAIQIHRYGMNEKKGVIARIAKILKLHDVSFEHNPTGLDSVSIIVDAEAIRNKEQEIIEELKERLSTDTININRDIALVCLVGENLVHGAQTHVKVAAKVFETLAKEEINTTAIVSAAGGIDIVVAIDEKDLTHAIQSLHRAFF